VVHSLPAKEGRAELARHEQDKASPRESIELLTKVITESRPSTEAAIGGGDKAERRSERPRLTREERILRWKERYAERLQRVHAEPRDPSWAGPTERLFRDDFGQRAEQFEAQVVGVECKTTTCLAKVRWESYGKAKAKFMDVVHESFSTNCATTMDVGSEPPNPEAPHEALVIFECEGARVGALEASAQAPK